MGLKKSGTGGTVRYKIIEDASICSRISLSTKVIIMNRSPINRLRMVINDIYRITQVSGICLLCYRS